MRDLAFRLVRTELFHHVVSRFRIAPGLAITFVTIRVAEFSPGAKVVRIDLYRLAQHTDGFIQATRMRE